MDNQLFPTIPKSRYDYFLLRMRSDMKITMTTRQGQEIDRLPTWIKRVTQNISVSPVYDAIFWNPPKKYVFKNRPPPRPQSVRVYEAHGIVAHNALV